jgi:NADH:ubiquinone oxidoreductase subunit E
VDWLLLFVVNEEVHGRLKEENIEAALKRITIKDNA